MLMNGENCAQAPKRSIRFCGIVLVWASLLIGEIVAIPSAEAGNITGLLRAEGSSVSPISTLTSVPAIYIGRASLLTTDAFVILFSVTDPVGFDVPDLLTLNLTNLTGQTLSALDIQIGQLNASGEFESQVVGGALFLNLPTLGGRIINPSHFRMEHLEWESGGNALTVNPLLFVPAVSTLTNGELAIQIEAIAVPEATTSVLLCFLGYLAFFGRSRRVE